MKKILMLGFETLPEIMTVAGVAQRFGAEAVNVPRSGWGTTLEALSRGETGASTPHGAPVGRMLVLCGLDDTLDELLPALRSAGIVCQKAVLTPSNRNWTPSRLYRELEREHRAMGGR